MSSKFGFLVFLLHFLGMGECLKCLTGLGNTSQKKNLESVDCPEHERYVCLKMYGGGMGDQIRRKCLKLDEEAYSQLLMHEEAKARYEETGVDPTVTDGFDGVMSVNGGDPACHSTTDHGRKVKVCYCTQDECNMATSLKSQIMAALSFAILCVLILN